ncbi:N-acetylmuramoyl-L-alanine amidase sle1 precursor [Synechococcus sp. MIT S9509]|uniref:LysM peptidoglycan-binding domain-containing protein n=1 Tax=unclassified Synechococcus TaxID=2626047 RepID=UPI0007BC4BEB|nr:MULTISPECIES: LysM peptidoglycan-binding domain-containing protein [unclassified Synechococcus]KZR83271.1 N-acetylmuramoyl-L-alanine amidase sle1 precursor [Synechococcus sp. MIT S9504]KZR88302.1 N-acetylmuramoyl-L-alanine amidase sle1 precursor [Synechococcus sp. MIT S9509]
MRRTLLTVLAAMALTPIASHGSSVTVKSGETLSDIAARYGVSMNSLMRLNGIRNSDHVEAGQTLRLPGSVSAGKGRHNVRSGDTLSGIAAQYRVSERQLMALNALSSADHVEVGQTLKLPSNAVLPQAKPRATAKPVPIQAKPNAISHIVARGQTLTQIARAYDIPITSLININAIQNPNQVNIGTQLMLRSTESNSNASIATSTTPAERQPLATESQPQEQKPAQAQSKTENVKPTAANPATVKPEAVQPAAAKPKVVKPVTTAKASQTATTNVQPKPASWRTYGPLQVDWGNWQSMGGSEVAPTLNSDGQSLYVAVNCSARKINATGANGMWKSWIAPQSEFEKSLVKDRCTAAKG